MASNCWKKLLHYLHYSSVPPPMWVTLIKNHSYPLMPLICRWVNRGLKRGFVVVVVLFCPPVIHFVGDRTGLGLKFPTSSLFSKARDLFCWTVEWPDRYTELIDCRRRKFAPHLPVVLSLSFSLSFCKRLRQLLLLLYSKNQTLPGNGANWLLNLWIHFFF